MNVITYQRALHMWPPWQQSIDTARRALRYRTDWPVSERVQWVKDNYSKVRDAGHLELSELRLPPNLLQYWEDCLYCDFFSDDGQLDLIRIRRAIGRYNEDGEFVEGQPSVPELPWEAELVWYDQEDVHDTWLRVEIRVHRDLASLELLQDAAQNAYKTIEVQRLVAGDPLHPLHGIINRAKVAPAEWLTRAVAIYHETNDVNEVLRTLYFDPETQAELKFELGNRPPAEAERIERRYRAGFRSKVIKGLQRAGIDTSKRPRVAWWLTE